MFHAARTARASGCRCVEQDQDRRLLASPTARRGAVCAFNFRFSSRPSSDLRAHDTQRSDEPCLAPHKPFTVTKARLQSLPQPRQNLVWSCAARSCTKRSSIAALSVSYNDRLKTLEEEVKRGYVSCTDRLVDLEETIDSKSNFLYSMKQEKARTTTVLRKTIVKCYRVRCQKQRERTLRRLARDTDLERRGTIKENPSHDFKSRNQRC